MRPLLPLVFLLLSGCGGRETAPTGQPAADITIPLESCFRELRTVRAILDRDTLTLLLDTGGGATLLTPVTASRIGCRPYGRDVGHRMSGEPVEFQRCDSVSVALSGWIRRVAPVAVFDLNRLLPPQLPRVDGVLALDAFRGQVVTIDWPARRLIVHARGTSDRALAAEGLPIRAATGESGRMLAAFARVAGSRGDLWFLLDSGNLRGTLVDAHLRRDSLLLPGPDSLVELRIGARAPIRVPAQPGSFILDGVLGTDYLQRGAVALDLRSIPP
jgi:hypothetical protein